MALRHGPAAVDQGEMGAMMANVADTIRAETQAYRNKTAVIDGPVRLTYAELLIRAEALSAALKEAGVRPAQRVALAAEDSADYVMAALAILAASAVMVPLAPTTAGEEKEQVLARMGVNWLLFETRLNMHPDAVPFGVPHFSSKSFSLGRLDIEARLPAQYYEMNPAFIRFSSGTTGTSKGVLLSHETVLERTAAANPALEISAEDSVLWVLSMNFHFVVSILLYLRRGATIVVCSNRFPFTLFEGIARHRGTFIYASPFHYQMLAGSALFPADALRGVRMAVSTAMALSADVAAAFQKKFGLPLTCAYGIIEVGLPFVNRLGGSERVCAVGRAQPAYEVRLDQPEPDGTGEILIRGPGFFDAYVDPWQPRADVCPDGWFRTGDLGRLDQDGCLQIVGRAKTVINFAGMKVFPDEVEGVLRSHPDVADALVFGAPHPPFGQMPCARIVPRNPAAPPSPAVLRAYCAERLTSYKVPGGFEMVAAIEKTASGKIRRA